MLYPLLIQEGLVSQSVRHGLCLYSSNNDRLESTGLEVITMETAVFNNGWLEDESACIFSDTVSFSYVSLNKYGLKLQ